MTHRVFSRNASSSRAIPHASLTVRDADIYVPRSARTSRGCSRATSCRRRAGEAERIWRDMAETSWSGPAELSRQEGPEHPQAVGEPAAGVVRLHRGAGHLDRVVELRCAARSTRRPGRDRGPGEGDEGGPRCAPIPRTLKHGQWHLPYVGEEDIENVERHAAQALLADGVDRKSCTDRCASAGGRDISPPTPCCWRSRPPAAAGSPTPSTTASAPEVDLRRHAPLSCNSPAPTRSTPRRWSIRPGRCSCPR
jgi:hypothetical protein